MHSRTRTCRGFSIRSSAIRCPVRVRRRPNLFPTLRINLKFSAARPHDSLKLLRAANGFEIRIVERRVRQVRTELERGAKLLQGIARLPPERGNTGEIVVPGPVLRML